jgi:hypothetical protein
MILTSSHLPPSSTTFLDLTSNFDRTQSSLSPSTQMGPTATATFVGVLTFTALSLLFSTKMDCQTNAQLEEVRKKTPRYLFRVWNNTPNIAIPISGRHADLNTSTAITPFAFSKDKGSKSIHGLSRAEFVDMALAHLHGRTTPPTQFSSWAASLAVALRFWNNHMAAGGHASDATIAKNVHISIIDTHLLPSNHIFFVPALDFLAPNQMSTYHHEYLAHASISGPGLKSMPIGVFMDGYEKFVKDPWGSQNGGGGTKLVVLTEACVTKARKVGEAYGGPFAVPMTLACLMMEKRDGIFQKDVVSEAVYRLILKSVEGLYIPADWMDDQSIMSDIVYRDRYPEVEQFIRVMRLLSGYGGIVVPQQSAHHEGQERPTSKTGASHESSKVKGLYSKTKAQANPVKPMPRISAADKLAIEEAKSFSPPPKKRTPRPKWRLPGKRLTH